MAADAPTVGASLVVAMVITLAVAVRWPAHRRDAAAGTRGRPRRPPHNPFFPDDTTVNVSDCVSALPRPECGSEERGGWRQGVVFGVIVVGARRHRRPARDRHPPS